MSERPLIPANSVEFETITTHPAFGSEEVDLDWCEYTDEKTKEVRTTPWKSMSWMTRDWRLGNTSPKLHDINYQWSALTASGNLLLLRKGRFEKVFVSNTLAAATINETSQSIGMAMRKNARTLVQEQSYTDKSPSPGFLSKMFGGKGGGS